jgi:predicted ArsR family transcriptional regulator
MSDSVRKVQAAARQAAFFFAGTQRARIYDALQGAAPAGLTADELEHRLGLSGNAVRPRLLELAEMGAIKRTDRTRRTRSGALALLWVAVEGYEP